MPRLVDTKAPVATLKHRLSFFYCERCVIAREEGGLVIEDAEGTLEIPAASLATLLLGPGVSITHAAVTLLSEVGCLVAWTGEDGVRLYAFGASGAENARRAGVQAKAVSDDYSRMIVAKRMLSQRFGLELSELKNLRQIRGKEGSIVRQMYRRLAEEYGVEWHGRVVRGIRWAEMDSANRALSTANACLNALCHVAVLSLGYIPSLGFIHTGQRLSFVYDIADLYKHRLAVPVAFQEVAQGEEALERRVRIAMRDKFRQTGFLGQIVKDMDALFEPIRVVSSAAKELAQWLS